MITFLAYVALVVIVAQVGYKAVTRIARGGRKNELIAHRYKVHTVRYSSGGRYEIDVDYSIDGGQIWKSLNRDHGYYSSVALAERKAKGIIRSHRRHLEKTNDGWVVISCNGRVSSGV